MCTPSADDDNTNAEQTLVRLTVCVLCTDTSHGGEEGIGAGAELYQQLCDRLTAHPAKDHVEIQTYRCLMACTEGCVVAFAQQGKMQYLLGRFSVSTKKIDELLDFAALYAASPTGVVPQSSLARRASHALPWSNSTLAT